MTALQKMAGVTLFKNKYKARNIMLFCVFRTWQSLLFLNICLYLWLALIPIQNSRFYDEFILPDWNLSAAASWSYQMIFSKMLKYIIYSQAVA